MSQRIEASLPNADARPTRPGSRRRPRHRQHELRRPSQVYRLAVEVSIAKLTVIGHLREDGFSRT